MMDGLSQEDRTDIQDAVDKVLASSAKVDDAETARVREEKLKRFKMDVVRAELDLDHARIDVEDAEEDESVLGPRLKAVIALLK